MRCFSIAYDLRKPGRNYEDLIATLNKWGAVKPLKSDWLLRTDATAEQIRNALTPLIDANDGLFVAALSGEAAWTNVLCGNAAAQSEITGNVG